MRLKKGVLLGLGNPLLDITVESDKTFLDKYDLKPNDAVLVKSQQYKMFEDLKRMEGVQFTAGGATQNSVRISQWILGLKRATCFMGCIGNDENGSILTKVAENDGVDVHYQITSAHPTGLCGVVITDSGRNRSLCATLGAANHFTVDHILREWDKVKNADYFYVSGFFLDASLETVRKVAEHAKETDKTFCFNLAATFICRKHSTEILDLLDCVNILVGNESEFQAFGKALGMHQSTDFEKIASEIANKRRRKWASPFRVLVTRGEHPISVFIGDHDVKHFPIPRLPREKVVDSNGAGDAFIGGFIAKDILGGTLEECLDCGIWAAHQALFTQNPCQHPIVILKDVSIDELRIIIDFVYKGEVEVPDDKLSAVLKTARLLRINGFGDAVMNQGIGQQTRKAPHSGKRMPMWHSSSSSASSVQGCSLSSSHLSESSEYDQVPSLSSPELVAKRKVPSAVVPSVSPQFTVINYPSDVNASVPDNSFRTSVDDKCSPPHESIPLRKRLRKDFGRDRSSSNETVEVHSKRSASIVAVPSRQTSNVESSFLNPGTCRPVIQTQSSDPGPLRYSGDDRAESPIPNYASKHRRMLQRQPRIQRQMELDAEDAVRKFPRPSPAIIVTPDDESRPREVICARKSSPSRELALSRQSPDSDSSSKDLTIDEGATAMSSNMSSHNERRTKMHVMFSTSQQPSVPGVESALVISTPSLAHHCPESRYGSAVSCDYCWNKVDEKGRVQRRKTKYWCPKCRANLCIVPCFQQYHHSLAEEENANVVNDPGVEVHKVRVPIERSLCCEQMEGQILDESEISLDVSIAVYPLQIFRLPGEHTGPGVSGNDDQPKPRSGHRAVCDDGHLYIFGGYNPEVSVNDPVRLHDPYWAQSHPAFRDLWAFNFSTKLWRRIPVASGIPPEAAVSYCFFKINHRLFVYGGSGPQFGYSSSNHLSCFDLEKRSWHTVECSGRVPHQMYGQGSAINGNKLFVIGGTGGNMYSNDVDVLDMSTMEWKNLWSMNPLQPKPRYRHEVVFYKNSLWMFGGGTAEDSYELCIVPVFSLITNDWKETITHADPVTKRFPLSRKCHSLVQNENMIYICGGCDPDRIRFTMVWRFNLDTLEWTELSCYLPCGLYFHSACITPAGKMYVFGGVKEEGYDRENKRTNGLYYMWVRVPSLAEMCWDVLTTVNGGALATHSKKTLKAIGVPLEFVDRIYPDSIERESFIETDNYAVPNLSDGTCGVCDKTECRRQHGEAFIEGVHPWKHLFVARDLDDAIDEFLELTLKEHVYAWYENLSDNECFVNEVRLYLRRAFCIILRRLKKVNIEEFIVRKVLPSLLWHLNACVVSQNSGQRETGIERSTFKYYGPNLHVALRSRSGEMQYLRAVSQMLVSQFLGKKYSGSGIVPSVVRELLANAILAPVMDTLADPDVINQWIISAFSNGETPFAQTKGHDEPVEFLAKFVSRRPVFYERRVTSLSIKDILKNQNLLFKFMQFLKDQGAVRFLQFVLAVDDLNMMVIQPELTDSGKRNARLELEKLHGTYFRPESAEYIEFPKTIVERLEDILHGPTEKVVELRSSTCLFEGYDFAYNILEKQYAPLFQETDVVRKASLPLHQSSSDTLMLSAFQYFSLFWGPRLDDLNKNQQLQRVGSFRTSGKLKKKLESIKGVIRAPSPVEGMRLEDDESEEVGLPEELGLEEVILPENFGSRPDLTSLTVKIPYVEHRLDLAGKSFYVFVLEVREGSSHSRVLERKFNEFYALETKLTEFHGYLPTRLPPKFTFGSKNLEYMESRRLALEDYLAKLLAIPDLAGSELIHAFLQTELEFTTSLFPDINFRRMIRSVPKKLLRKERGQNLEPFLTSFVASTEAPKPRPSKLEFRDNSVEAAELRRYGLENPLYENNAKSTMVRSLSCEVSRVDQVMPVEGVYEMTVYLIAKVFGSSFLSVVLCLKPILRRTVDAWFCRLVRSRLIERTLSSDCIAAIVHIVKDFVFINESKPRTDQEKVERADTAWLAFRRAYPGFVETVVGADRITTGSKQIFCSLQQPKLNKQLSYALFDLVLAELFPEVNLQDEQSFAD
ncbi:unnamed protein product [Notodromas monacha]|uniref:adenosine kinase n=1 Tax=Notodromas monacha TaxID=399045 RepID=A0A7R9GFY2_9CRUS|nr:unnamed protein product [Notodromas monacha]CAG0919808.1 unnamed protein product [Notodromas monacha]